MHCRIAIPLLFLFTLSPTQAATLKGVILANEIGGPPMPIVQVTAAAGASSTASLSDGSFTLQFPKKQPGEMILLVVRKEGYVVVNDVQLRLPLPKDADAEILTLLLCKEGDREEMTRRFYRLKDFEVVEQTYQKRIKELEEKNKATAETLEQLRKDRDQARAAAERTAEELARLKPEPTSQLYQQALSLFLSGKPEEASMLLDEEELRHSADASRQLEAEAKEKREAAVQSFILRARILTSLFRFDESEKAYKSAVEVAPDSFEAQFVFARFNQDLNRFSTALNGYLQCLELARRSQNQANLASTLNNLGNLYSGQNRTDEARQAYEEALKILRELAQKDSEAYLPHVATTLNNLGTLYNTQNRMDEARQTYEEALKILHDFAQKNPETYLPGVAMTLNNLGSLHSSQNRIDEARQAYEAALKIRRALAQQNPETYLPYVATTLNNLGILYSAQNRMVEALQAYEEALKIRREFAQKNLETYLPKVATTLNNLGKLHSTQNQMVEARQAYEEALKIYRQLAQKNPETYLPEVATTLNNLGILHSDQNQLDEARQAFEVALEIRRRFAQKSPETYLPDVAATLNSLGILDSTQNRTDEAR